MKFAKKDHFPDVNTKNQAVFSHWNLDRKLKYRQLGAGVLEHSW